MPWVRGLSSQTKLLPSSCRGWGGGQALAVPCWDTSKQKLIWYHQEERGKGLIYIPDSRCVRQQGLKGREVRREEGRAASGGQLAPGLRQCAREGDPWSTASEFGRKAATDGVSQSAAAECCSKGWRAVRMTGWALSHFPFHITPGMGEIINETLAVNRARTRLKCVSNFSQEICLLVLLYYCTGIAFQFACCLSSPGCWRLL